MALGRGEVQGINQRLFKWCKSNPEGPLGILFMDFVSVKRKGGRADDEEESDLELIRELVKRQLKIRSS